MKNLSKKGIKLNNKLDNLENYKNLIKSKISINFLKKNTYLVK